MQEDSYNLNTKIIPALCHDPVAFIVSFVEGLQLLNVCNPIVQEDNFNLETKIMSELKDLEEQAAHTSSLIDMERATKRDVLAEVVEVRAITACPHIVANHNGL